MATKFDVRQAISRDVLDQIANAAGTELDNILRLINSELISPLRMEASASPDLVVTVESSTVTNSTTGRRRTIPPINDLLPSFTSGTITLPASNSGTITVSPGTNVLLSMGTDEYAKVIVSITDAGNLAIAVGAGAASEALAVLPVSPEGVPIGYFVIQTVAGVMQNVANTAIVKFVGGGGGGGAGGVVQIREDLVTGQTGTTITFTQNYSANKKVLFFRNGVLMHRVAAFSVSGDELAFEYMEVDLGSSSNQITLNPNTDGTSSGPAVSGDVFEFRFIQNTFDGIGLAEKTITTARGFADNTETINCSVAQAGSYTQVNLSGFTYVAAVSAGQTTGDLVVRVNGQDVEREVAGINDNAGDINYTEDASGTFIRIKEVGTGELPSAALIEVILRQYFVSEIDNIASNVIPDTDNTRDLGATSRRWRDLYLGPDTIHIGTNGTLEGQIKWDSATQKLQFRHLPTDSWADFGTGGGGGGSDAAGILGALGEEELNSLSSIVPNQIIDAFNDNTRGTKVNMTAAADALRIDSGQLAGSYTRKLAASVPAGTVSGVAVHTTQQLAPKDGQTVPMNGASQQIKFTGDVTDMFANTKEVLIAKLLPDTDPYADGFNRFQFIPNATPDAVNKFAVSGTPSYNSGTDETTITITNLGTPVDLAQGLGTNDLHAQMRVVPWDYQYQVRSDSGEALEEMPLADASLSDIIRLPGETPALALDGSLAPTSEDAFVVFSANKQYGVYWVKTNDSGADTWRWYYSVNRGKSWTSLGTRTAGTDTNIGAIDSTHYYANAGQVVIANNGKMFGVYPRFNASSWWGVYGVYSDLSVGSPTLSDTPDTGAGSATPTTGRVFSNTDRNAVGVVGGDPIDGSYFCVLAQASAGNIVRLQCFTNGGATHDGTSSTNFSSTGDWIKGAFVIVTGTGTAHKAHVVYRNGTTDNEPEYYQFDQGNTSAVYSNTNIFGGTSLEPVSFKISGTYGYLLAEQNNVKLAIIQNILTTPSVLAVRDISSGSGGYNSYRGVGDTGDVNPDNHFKVYNKRLQVNPSDPSHVYIAMDYTNPSGEPSCDFREVKDAVSGWKGIQISQYSSSGGFGMDNGSQYKIAQTFNASSTRIRAVGIRLWRSSLSANLDLSCEIQTTTAGVPDGGGPGGSPVVALNTIDTSELGVNSSGEWRWFLFDDANLDSLTGDYAIVITPSADPSGIHIHFQNPGNPYAGGKMFRSTSATSWSDWTTGAADLSFEINGEWVTQIAISIDNNVSFNSEPNQPTSGSIEFIDSNQLRYVYRRHLHSTANKLFDLSGYSYSRIATIGAGLSTVTSAKVIGFRDDSFDPYLVFNVALGSDESRPLNVETGGFSGGDDQAVRDRSGNYLIYNSHQNLSTSIDANFQEDIALVYNGTNSTNSYVHDVSQNLGLVDFIIEVEVHPSALNTHGCILSKRGTGNFWQLTTGASGYLTFVTDPGTGEISSVASDKTEPLTYHKIRVVRTSGTVRLYRSEGAALTSGPNGSSVFTEVSSYSSQITDPAKGVEGGTNLLRVGHDGISAAPTGWFNGKIGYIKIARASNSFQYHGWKNQAPLIYPINCGHLVSSKRVIGENSSSNMATPYYTPVLMNPEAAQAALVDSYDIIAQFQHTLAGVAGNALELKLDAGRVSERNQSSVQGLNFRFSK